MTRRVCIVQPVMKQYRVPFFLALSDSLARRGIELRVVYGRPWEAEARRGDHAELPTPLGVPVKSRLLAGRVLWMPVFAEWWRADLVVVEHAGKHLLNYVLTALRLPGLVSLAYWGHGRDRQGDPDSGLERVKRWMLHHADWWFGYTRSARAYLVEAGFPAQKITLVQNAVDTVALRTSLAAVTLAQQAALRSRLGWKDTARIGIYCGSLYPNKRLDWLMEAADRIHSVVPDFCLLIVGGGALADEVAEYAASRSWVAATGPAFGEAKAGWLRLAEIWLNPGLVGLGILDAFCAGLPLLTCSSDQHGPEIDYLESGVNGLIVQPGVEAFAQATLELLGNASALLEMQTRARESCERYSLEAMVDNFASGVEACLCRS